MGLAASQAELLTITARIHDIEYEVMGIMNNKVMLNDEETAALDKYDAALNAKKLQIKCTNSDGSLSYVDGDFTSIFGYNNERNGTFALIDKTSGFMIVEDDAYKAYQQYDNDKYAFAWAMLGFEQNDAAWNDTGYEGTGDQIGLNSPSGDPITLKDGSTICVRSMTEAEQYVFDQHANNLDDNVQTKYDCYQEALKKGDREKISKALDAFRDAFTQKYFQEIFDVMRIEKAGVSKAESLSEKEYIPGFEGEYNPELKKEFDYYVRMFEGIEHAGGCISVNKFAKDSTDNSWLKDMLDYNSATIKEYNNSKGSWSTINPSSATGNIKEVDDEEAIQKAENEYRRTLNEIHKKEAKMDQDLKSLESERMALNNESETLKKFIDDNIKRTFKA